MNKAKEEIFMEKAVGSLVVLIVKGMVFLNLIRAVILHPSVTKRAFKSQYTDELKATSRKYMSLMSCQYMYYIGMAMTYLTINRDLRLSKQRCLADILESRNVNNEILETGKILFSLRDYGGEDMKALIELVYAYQ